MKWPLGGGLREYEEMAKERDESEGSSRPVVKTTSYEEGGGETVAENDILLTKMGFNLSTLTKETGRH